MDNMDKMMSSGPTGEMMGKKVGGKMTIGQYISFQKQYYMWLVIAALVGAVLTLFGWGWLTWLVQLYGAFVFFWFGYQLVKEKRGELKDALLGGAVLGVIPAILLGLGWFIYFAFLFRPLGFLGITGGFGVGYGIGQLVGWIIGGAIGGLVMSLIGYAVAGGFSKPAAKQM